MNTKKTVEDFLMNVSVCAKDYNKNNPDVKVIKKRINKLSKILLEKKYDKLSSIYCKDSTHITKYSEIDKKPLFKLYNLFENIDIISYEIKSKEINVIKKNAYDFGYYAVKATNENGERIDYNGTYLNVWKKKGKKWKIYMTNVNNNTNMLIPIFSS